MMTSKDVSATFTRPLEGDLDTELDGASLDDPVQLGIGAHRIRNFHDGHRRPLRQGSDDAVPGAAASLIELVQLLAAQCHAALAGTFLRRGDAVRVEGFLEVAGDLRVAEIDL